MSLLLKTPIYKEEYIGKGVRQKAAYIDVPEINNLLADDVNNGAKIYEPLLKIETNNESRVSIIAAPSSEDCFRAATYLEAYRQSKKPFSEDKEEIIANENLEFSYDEIDEIDSSDLWNDDDDDYDDGQCGHIIYVEKEYKLPVIPLSDILIVQRNQTIHFGGFQQEPSASFRSPNKWWEDCTELPVCVMCNNSFTGFFKTDTLTSEDINALKRFSTNEHLYILIPTNNLADDDISITKCVLEFTANFYKILPDEKELQAYYQKVLIDVAGSYGLKFSANADLQLLTKKLTDIDYNKPCGFFDKIMLYLKHNNIKEVIEPEHLDSLGLAKLINHTASTTSASKLYSELYGMVEVKRAIENIILMMKYTALRQKRGILSAGYHNVHLFIGAPGTAKTTVAKMMAAWMQEEGLIRGNRFISVSGAELKASYLGQTAHKVHALFQDYDAILIDEAYSLTSDTTGQDSYAEEALAQLAIELEEHACDKLIIFAGYGGKDVSKKNNRMYGFLEANPGIKSRINSTIYFDSYNSDEMVQLIHHMAKARSLSMSSACDDIIRDYFSYRCKALDFGNGREARSFLETVEKQIAGRVMKKDLNTISDKELGKISVNDIRTTIKSIQEMNDQQIGQEKILLGF